MADNYPYWTLVDEICYASRGYGDSPNNPYTTFDQAEASLRHYGIPVDYTSDYHHATTKSWSIVYCDGRMLNPDQYPDGWFNTGDPYPSGNHFVLWLPYWKESGIWLNNPLVPQQEDTEQTIDGFFGAYLLPETANGETGPVRRKVNQECGLKPQAAHGGQDMYTIPKNGELLDLGITVQSDDTWQNVQFRDKYGYVPKAYVVDL